MCVEGWRGKEKRRGREGNFYFLPLCTTDLFCVEGIRPHEESLDMHRKMGREEKGGGGGGEGGGLLKGKFPLLLISSSQVVCHFNVQPTLEGHQRTCT